MNCPDCLMERVEIVELTAGGKCPKCPYVAPASKITEQQAKEIHELFGPCTFLYECGDTEEIMAQSAECDTVKALLYSLFEAESLHLEQRGNQWSGENEEQFKKEVAEDKRFLKELRKRIREYLKKEKAA